MNDNKLEKHIEHIRSLEHERNFYEQLTEEWKESYYEGRLEYWNLRDNFTTTVVCLCLSVITNTILGILLWLN